jgi:hypothetical protein
LKEISWITDREEYPMRRRNKKTKVLSLGGEETKIKKEKKTKTTREIILM